MKFEEIKDLVKFEEQESKLFLPNEIFGDLKANMKKSIHIPVAYSYYYLVSWLYRHAKYGNILIDNKIIKEVLGYHRDQKDLDYIMKKNGLLDEIGYTETVKDFPVVWELDEVEGLKFTFLSEMDDYFQEDIKSRLSRKYSIKYPIKAFERVVDEEGNIEQEGTFFDISNTHCIPFEIFMFCMDNDNIGCTGFYLYSYIKHMNDIYSGGWDVSIDNLSSETGISKKTLTRYLDQLNLYQMVTTKHNQEYFCLALDPKDRKANTYTTNEYDSFTDRPQSYEKLKVVTTGDYYKKREEDLEFLFSNRIDIPLEDLPF